jgi:hypothetical protein
VSLQLYTIDTHFRHPSTSSSGAFALKAGAHQSIILRGLPQMYLHQHGYALCPENFDESNLNGIIEKLSATLGLDNAASH